MNHNQFDKTERRGVSDKDLKGALNDVLLAPSENRTSTNTELEARHRLDRRSRKMGCPPTAISIWTLSHTKEPDQPV